jgi:transcriptional regulator with XRE-family HTH domain
MYLYPKCYIPYVATTVESPGKLIREARRRHGVSQARLAARAGTTQSAISRIERDRVSPSVETLRELLYLLGEDLALGSQERDSGIDRTLNQGNLRFTPAERVTRGLDFADFVRRNRGIAVESKAGAA